MVCACWCKHVFVRSLVLESLELLEELHVVLLDGGDLVICGHAGEGVDEVVTETRVDVLGRHAASTRTVLSPVGEVTGQDVGGSYEVRRTVIGLVVVLFCV